MTSTSTSPHERELTFVRFFMASPDEVFDAWVRADKLARWWGPHDSVMLRASLDPRPGGSIRLELRGPDGRVHASRGSYLEVRRPVRLRFTETPAETPSELFVTTVDFEELGAMTRMTVTQTTAHQEQLAHWQPVGWLDTLSRLADYLLPR
jgi:uncharacterized protein YndB with AHSA1/START domain